MESVEDEPAEALSDRKPGQEAYSIQEQDINPYMSKGQPKEEGMRRTASQ